MTEAKRAQRVLRSRTTVEATGFSPWKNGPQRRGFSRGPSRERGPTQRLIAQPKKRAVILNERGPERIAVRGW
jgi:hypothetical protein